MRLLSPPTEQEDLKKKKKATTFIPHGVISGDLWPESWQKEETAKLCLTRPLSLQLLTQELPNWGSDPSSSSKDTEELRNPNNSYPLSPQTTVHQDQNYKVIFLTSRVNSCGSLTFYTKLSSESCLWARLGFDCCKWNVRLQECSTSAPAGMAGMYTYQLISHNGKRWCFI